MRKDSKKFYKFFFEAVKNRNEFGVDFEKDQEQYFLLPEKYKKDYTYHGVYKRRFFNKTREDDTTENIGVFYKQGDLAGKIKKRMLLKQQLRTLDADRKENMLFKEIKKIETARSSEMQNDIKKLSKEIDLIKRQKNSFDYQENLKKILKKFFMVPGAKLARRYIFLPVKRNFSMNDINLLNKSSKFDENLLNEIISKKEIFKNTDIDEEIIKYLKDNDYHFKTEKDFQNNICYTKKNAQIKISDELKKISLINLEQKENALKKIKDLEKINFIKKEIQKKKNLKDDYLKRIEAIEIENEGIDDKKNIRLIVLTWIPRLIMSQSTTTIWKSCMSLPTKNDSGGSNVRFVASGMDQGVFIAWLLELGDRREMDKPMARILIKPYENISNAGRKEYFWLPSKVYTDGSNTNDINIFKDVVGNFCYYKQKREIGKYKENVFRTVDPKKVYSDGSEDYAKKVLSLKNYFKDIKKHIDEDISFFNVSDFTTNKAMAYLKKINFSEQDHLKFRILMKFTLFSLQEQNLTIFSYLADKNKNSLQLAISAFFDMIAGERINISKFRFNFLNYIFKYYSQLIEKKDEIFFDIITNKNKNIMSEIILNNFNLLKDIFDSNRTDDNFDLILGMVDRLEYAQGSPEMRKIISRVFNSILDNNALTDIFGLSDEKVGTCKHTVKAFFDLNRELKNTKENEIWDKIKKSLSPTIGETFIVEYISELIYKIDSADNIDEIKELEKYLKILKDKNIKNPKLMNRLNIIMDQYAENYGIHIPDKLIDEIVDSQIDLEKASDEDFVSLAHVSSEKFEILLPKIFEKNSSKEAIHNLQEQFEKKVKYFNTYKNEEEKEQSKELKDTVKKYLFFLNNYYKEVDLKQDFVIVYFSLVKTIDKKILQIFKEKKCLNEATIEMSVLELLETNNFQDFKNNFSELMKFSSLQKIKITNSLFQMQILDPSRETEMDKKISMILDYLDLSKLYEEISAYKDFGFLSRKYYVNIRRTDFIKKLVKDKISDVFRYSIFVNSLNFNMLDMSSKLHNYLNDKDAKVFFDNAKLLFENDFDYAMKVATEYSQRSEIIIILAKIFNIKPETFYRSEIFKKYVEKNIEDLKPLKLLMMFEKIDLSLYEKYIKPLVGKEDEYLRIKFLNDSYSSEESESVNKEIKNNFYQSFKEINFERISNKNFNTLVGHVKNFLPEEINEKDLDDIENVYLKISEGLRMRNENFKKFMIDRKEKAKKNIHDDIIEVLARDHKKAFEVFQASENKEEILRDLTKLPEKFFKKVYKKEEIANEHADDFSSEYRDIESRHMIYDEDHTHGFISQIITILDILSRYIQETNNKNIKSRIKKIYFILFKENFNLFLNYEVNYIFTELDPIICRLETEEENSMNVYIKPPAYMNKIAITSEIKKSIKNSFYSYFNTEYGSLFLMTKYNFIFE